MEEPVSLTTLLQFYCDSLFISGLYSICLADVILTFISLCYTNMSHDNIGCLKVTAKQKYNCSCIQKRYLKRHSLSARYLYVKFKHFKME